MKRLIRTEWLKVASTRAPRAIVAALLALTALITPLAIAEIGGSDATSRADAREALAIGPGFITALVLLLLGALASAGEFQHRTVITTYLITPRRGRVLWAKVFAHAVLGAVVAGLGVAISFPIVLVMAAGDHIDVGDGTYLAGLALAIIAVGALSSILGVAAGSILRSPTTAIVVILVWTLMVERFFGGLVPPVLPFGGLLAALGMAGDDGPGVLASLSVVTAWAGALVVLANYRFIRLDVT